MRPADDRIVDTTAHDPEVQALLDLSAGLRRWVTRAAGHCRRALVWRVGVIGALTLAWSLLWLFATPSRPAPVRSHYRITQAFDQTGRRITRQEWTDRALSETDRVWASGVH